MLGIAVGGEDLDNTAKVTANVSGDTATLDVRLSVAYPASVGRTTENARRHLRRRVEEFTVAVIAIQTIVGETPWVSYQSVAGALHNAHWNDLIPAVAGGAAALIGLILLLAAILRAAASTVDGVSGAKVKLKRHKISAKVTTGRTTTDGLADAVRGAIEHRLDQITPATRPAVKVKVHAARSAS